MVLFALNAPEARHEAIEWYGRRFDPIRFYSALAVIFALWAVLGAYRETLTDARLWPASTRIAEGMLNFFILEKVFYEIEYELAYRPEWLRVPLAGALRILSQQSKEFA